MTDKKRRSSSLERLTIYYPSQQLKDQLARYAKDERISVSKATTYAVKELFRNMPVHLQERYSKKGKLPEGDN